MASSPGKAAVTNAGPWRLTGLGDVSASAARFCARSNQGMLAIVSVHVSNGGVGDGRSGKPFGGPLLIVRQKAARSAFAPSALQAEILVRVVVAKPQRTHIQSKEEQAQACIRMEFWSQFITTWIAEDLLGQSNDPFPRTLLGWTKVGLLAGLFVQIAYLIHSSIASSAPNFLWVCILANIAVLVVVRRALRSRYPV
ncbi:hypothetical protein [Bradyrhizobium roseum]|uniref:hypothetical protein n=1 Tax=Bradyrhizobium roseum TaxID=3056648 RepID=UPI00261C4AE9|nr:hypothetical protein [Bradyrhizobium roseus]WKA29721.1 hypothetical protein QUH67_05930 [Bradyrhizobium roseus]